MTTGLNRRLCERFGITDITLAMGAFLDQKFGAGQVGAVPCNVYELAEDCGLSIQVLDSFPHSGLIMGTRDNDVILVNGRDDPYRQRFTIAHELMHFVLRSLVAETNMEFSKEEESLCNLGASLLLVPREYFDRACNARRASSALIQIMRRDCEISHEFAAATLAIRHPGSFIVVKWKQDSDESLFLEKASRSASFPNRIWLEAGLLIPYTRVFARWAADFEGTKRPNYFVFHGAEGKEYLDADHMTLGKPNNRYVLSILHTRPGLYVAPPSSVAR